ncbi:MAG: carbon-nitrogen hydrolase family protein [Desulfurococcales archaeon]|nr:carbon-nitrogen hydrolase family protein [Desulfurococcales archaeon]
MEEFLAAAIQMKIHSFDRELNLKNAVKLIDKAASFGAKLIVLPEYFVSECPSINKSPEDLKKMATPVEESSVIKRIASEAKRVEAYIVAGTILERDGDDVYNTSVLIGPTGEVIGRQRKTHPENHLSKREVELGVKPSNELKVFNTELGKLSILIDVDANIPEVAVSYAILGAEIIAWTLNWSVRWAYLVPAIASTYAYVTQTYVVAANRAMLREEQVGPYPLYYMGPSVIANPEGEIVGYAGSFYEGIAVGIISREIMKTIKDYNKDVYPLGRRPEVFKDIIARK